MRRALVLSAFLLIGAGCDNGVSHPRCAICIEASDTEKGRTRILLHHGPARSRLRAVRPAPVPPDGRAVLLRRRSGAVRVRRATLLVLRRASDRRRRRPLRRADVLLPARAALPLVRAAAADAVRAAEAAPTGTSATTIRSTTTSARATSVINDAYAPVVYTRPVVDVRVAPPAFHGEIVAGGPGMAAHAVVGAPVVSAGVYVAAPPPPVVQVGIGVGIGGRRGGSARTGLRDVHDNGRHNGWYKHGRGGPPPQHGWRGAPPPQTTAGAEARARAAAFAAARAVRRPRGTATPAAARPAPAPGGGCRGSPAPAAHGQPGHRSKGWKR